MKKRKSIFTYISMMVLSLCVLVSGVYAAKSASMTASGQVSFTAANCKVAITNVACSGQHADSQINAFSEVSLESVGGTTSGSYAIGSLLFDDVTSNGDTINDITVAITVQNNSDFSINVTSSGSGDGTNYTMTTDKTTATTVTKGNTTTVNATLHCVKTSNFKDIGFTITINCVKVA